MRDLLMLLLTAGFFALCIAYVRWCDRIIGPDPADLESSSNADAVTQNEDDEVRA